MISTTWSNQTFFRNSIKLHDGSNFNWVRYGPGHPNKVYRTLRLYSLYIFSYAEDTIRFQCNYNRQITVNQSYEVEDNFQPQPIQGQGELTYIMEIAVGNLGGTTEIRVIPNHGLNQVAPTWVLNYYMRTVELIKLFRFTECKVVDASNTHEVFLMHSFAGDSVCFDNSRLNVIQTDFFPNASFEMRTFRFNTGGSSTEAQQQTVMCSLHLDPVNDITQEQANNCSCYTRSECEQSHLLRGMTIKPLIAIKSLIFFLSNSF